MGREAHCDYEISINQQLESKRCYRDQTRQTMYSLYELSWHLSIIPKLYFTCIFKVECALFITY